MIEFEIYSIGDSPNAVSKSLEGHQIFLLRGTLRESTSLLRPSILVDSTYIETEITDADGMELADENGSAVNIGSGSMRALHSANYAHIPSFGRYYFIRDIVQESNRITRIDMEVDALMSYKDEILGLSALVIRNEGEDNPLIADQLVPLVDEYSVSQMEFPQEDITGYSMGSYIGFDATASPASVRAVFSSVSSNDDFSYDTASIRMPPWLRGGTIRPDNLIPKNGTTCYALTFAQVSNMARYLVQDSYSSKLTYIKSLVYLPFDISRTESLGNETYIYLGNLPFGPVDSAGRISLTNAIKGRAIGSPISHIILNAGINRIGLKYDPFAQDASDYPEWMNYSPYCKTEVYIPFYGWYDFPMEGRLGHSIALFYTMNFSTGKGNCHLYDITAQQMVFTAPCAMGVQISLDATNDRLISLYQGVTLLKAVAEEGRGIAEVVGSSFGGNPIGIAKGVTRTISGVIGGLVGNQALEARKAAKAGFSDGVGWYYGDMIRAQIRYTWRKPIFPFQSSEHKSYASQNGLPCKKESLLKDVHGFTQVGSSILSIEGATQGEIADIARLLQSGVILP